MAVAVGAQAVDLHIPGIFEGYDESILEREGLLNEATAGGELNMPWLIAMSTMIGNAATVGMFFNPHYYDSEVGMDATGVGVGKNYTGAGGREAVGGSVIWW
jgi:hypothetical protein